MLQNCILLKELLISNFNEDSLVAMHCIISGCYSLKPIKLGEDFNFENRAYENGIEFDEQLRKENEDLMYGHEELQELQGQQGGIKR